VSTPPEAFTGELRSVLREMDPNLAVVRLETLDEALGMVLWVPRVTASVFGSFGVLALALAAVGIYGVLSFAVTLRGRELAIRMALGARPSDLRRLVLRQALALVFAGLALGLASSFAVTRLLAVALYGVSPTDPLTFGLVSALLVGVACLAAERPARRASRGTLLLSLRSE
jgi:ABC-type antimicrobial peptide transport system permease subunit